MLLQHPLAFLLDTGGVREIDAEETQHDREQLASRGFCPRAAGKALGRQSSAPNVADLQAAESYCSFNQERQHCLVFVAKQGTWRRWAGCSCRVATYVRAPCCWLALPPRQPALISPSLALCV